jgi:uncharacterized membrane protein YcaP (DUF421 family)
MESVFRAVVIYLFLLLVVRITGRRLLAELTTFDFVLLLIISEATQQAMLGEDFSIINAWVVIATLCSLEIFLAAVKTRFPRVDRWLDGRPVLVVQDGRPLEDRLRAEGVTRDDVLTAAREAHGIETFDEVKHAVVEESGSISIVPKRRS